MTPERRKELLESVARKRAAAHRPWPPEFADQAELDSYLLEHGYVMTYSITLEEAQALYEDGRPEFGVVRGDS